MPENGLLGSYKGSHLPHEPAKHMITEKKYTNVYSSSIHGTLRTETAQRSSTGD